MKLTVTNKWRNVVEMSPMVNNDEVIFYTDTEATPEEAKQVFPPGSFDSVKLVISRPVFDFELAEGLDTTYKGPKHSWRDDTKKEIVPDITRFLDAYFIIKQEAEVFKEIMGEKFSPTWFIAHHVAYSFYDCMSGGFPAYELMLCRLLAQDVRIDLDNYVYPAGKEHQEKTGRDHYTLLDFLNETQGTQERFQDKLKLLMDQFSFPMLEEKTQTGA